MGANRRAAQFILPKGWVVSVAMGARVAARWQACSGGLGFIGNFAAVLDDDALDDRQTNGSVHLGGDIGFEELRSSLGHARSVVFDMKTDVFVSSGSDDPYVRVVVTLCRITAF